VTELDNPVWWALTGRQRRLGRTSRSAGLFDPEISPFGAFSGQPTADHWDDLVGLIGPSGQVALVHPGDGVDPIPTPEGWTSHRRTRALQMTGERLVPRSDQPTPPGSGPLAALLDHPVALGADDVADMLALVEVARPGPFLPRTVEFSGYVGIRRAGRLVAMAGERIRLPGHVEISAVATHPDLRRQGLAETVVAAVAATAHERGEIPFLHVAASNAAAIALYESMGFTVRRTITFELVEAPPAG
jgi:ribosomal protein S18 acetylase RimI-like enzyme